MAWEHEFISPEAAENLDAMPIGIAAGQHLMYVFYGDMLGRVQPLIETLETRHSISCELVRRRRSSLCHKET